MTRVYLDNAATTRVDPAVLEKMLPYFCDRFGNPSSLHQFGQEVRAAVEEARARIANFLGVSATEIIFTAGGCEADNLAIKGVVLARQGKETKPHIITTKIEHHAVLHSFEDLKKEGLAEITLIGVNKYGEINFEELKKAIKPNTLLVSVMYANNEIGTVEPIEEIGAYLKDLNSQRPQKIYFHTDAVQATGYLDCNVTRLGVDLLTVSGHKIYGPKGIGCLYVKKGTKIDPLISGGSQEFRLRAGTENVPGIVGFGEAIEKIKNNKPKIKNVGKLRDYLIKGIIKKIPNTLLTGHPTKRLPNLASFCFRGIEGESILINLDLEGVAASSGSACTSGSLEASHVLTACGIEPIISHGSLRFSLGNYNTKADIDKVLKILPGIVEKLRKMSPIK